MGLLRFRPGCAPACRDQARPLRPRHRIAGQAAGRRLSSRWYPAPSRARARPGVRDGGAGLRERVRDAGHTACRGRPRYAAERQGAGIAPFVTPRRPAAALARAGPGVRNGVRNGGAEAEATRWQVRGLWRPARHRPAGQSLGVGTPPLRLRPPERPGVAPRARERGAGGGAGWVRDAWPRPRRRASHRRRQRPSPAPQIAFALRHSAARLRRVQRGKASR
jgi:hypothetical protein